MANDGTLPLTWTPLIDSLDLVALPAAEAVRAGAVPSAVLIDPAVAVLDEVLIGGGVRTSKILVPGHELAELAGAEVVPVAL
ncbi:hypothetical protein CIK81_02980 [Brachybacterium sp. JB7]|uniref:hypothetical protein n=1 Tax=Brachybacterium sp. JB7 TaxID=2024478 RepID=UPI000DF4C02E|nr:hypothetical protein [Brachybacterium sp. JB7]RCS66190.1 hypothetical protein CIK81_02980 [Brachybacterium sp. JB7]